MSGHWVRELAGVWAWSTPVRIDSPIYGDDLYGYVDSVLPEGGIQVRIEDPGPEHPAARDMLADFPDLTYDQLEFIDTVPYTAVRDVGTGETLPDPLPVIAAAAQARADAAEAAARAERIGRIRADLRAGKRKSAFPELPGLRGR